MQYTLGTVQIVNGGTVFIASADADWTDAKTELDSSHLVYIKILGSTAAYPVAAITTPEANAGHTPASRWEAAVTGVISDGTNTTASYVLYWNFTPNIGLPIPNPGDVDVEAIMGRAFAVIDAGGFGGGGGGGGFGARIYNSANISIPNNSNITLTFDSVRFDNNTFYSSGQTSRLTCKTAGKYIITGNVQFAGNATGPRQVWILLNGTLAIGLTNQSGISVNTGLEATAIWDLSAGDYIQLAVWQNSGAALNVLFASASSPEFAILGGSGGGGGGGGGTGQTYEAVTISAAGNTDSAQSATSFRHRMRVTVGAGGGAYTATITLPLANRVAGDECRVSMVFPANTNPTLEIHNATSGGTLLFSYNPTDGLAIVLWANFVFDGTAWYLESDGVTS